MNTKLEIQIATHVVANRCIRFAKSINATHLDGRLIIKQIKAYAASVDCNGEYYEITASLAAKDIIRKNGIKIRGDYND